MTVLAANKFATSLMSAFQTNTGNLYYIRHNYVKYNSTLYSCASQNTSL